MIYLKLLTKLWVQFERIHTIAHMTEKIANARALICKLGINDNFGLFLANHNDEIFSVM